MLRKIRKTQKKKKNLRSKKHLIIFKIPFSKTAFQNNVPLGQVIDQACRSSMMKEVMALTGTHYPLPTTHYPLPTEQSSTCSNRYGQRRARIKIRLNAKANPHCSLCKSFNIRRKTIRERRLPTCFNEGNQCTISVGWLLNNTVSSVSHRQ